MRIYNALLFVQFCVSSGETDFIPETTTMETSHNNSRKDADLEAVEAWFERSRHIIPPALVPSRVLLHQNSINKHHFDLTEKPAVKSSSYETTQDLLLNNSVSESLEDNLVDNGITKDTAQGLLSNNMNVSESIEDNLADDGITKYNTARESWNDNISVTDVDDLDDKILDMYGYGDEYDSYADEWDTDASDSYDSDVSAESDAKGGEKDDTYKNQKEKGKKEEVSEEGRILEEKETLEEGDNSTYDTHKAVILENIKFNSDDTKESDPNSNLDKKTDANTEPTQKIDTSMSPSALGDNSVVRRTEYKNEYQYRNAANKFTATIPLHFYAIMTYLLY